MCFHDIEDYQDHDHDHHIEDDHDNDKDESEPEDKVGDDMPPLGLLCGEEERGGW